MTSSEIAVVGAGGLVGRRVVAALVAEGIEVAAVARRAASLDGLAVRRAAIADALDADALARAVAGVRVVVNAAGPLRDTADPVLRAALAAGAHYVDVGGEQAVLRALYEQHESTLRRAGLVALPGAGLDCMIGDLAAALAAAHVAKLADLDEDPVRRAPAPRLAEGDPIDELAVTYAFDDLALSAGTQRAWFAAVGSRALVWRRDRWEPARAGSGRRVNAGPALGGERAAIAHAGGDAITLPRHVAANLVETFVSTTRRAPAALALRLLARALPLVPRAAGALLAPYADPAADFARTQFAVIAEARRGFDAAHVIVRGFDAYRATALAAAWAARALAARATGPVGVCAPGELFRSAPALRALAAAAELAIDPSFGPSFG